MANKKVNITDKIRDQVIELSSELATWKQISIFTGIAERTLKRHCSEEYQRGRELLGMDARKQWAKLLRDGSTQALKQWVTTQEDLNGKSKVELTGADGGPIQKIEMSKEMMKDISKALDEEF